MKFRFIALLAALIATAGFGETIVGSNKTTYVGDIVSESITLGGVAATNWSDVGGEGSGGGSEWSTYPATTNANMASNGIDDVTYIRGPAPRSDAISFGPEGIQVGGEPAILYEDGTNFWLGGIRSSDSGSAWSTHPATTNVNMANNSMTNMGSVYSTNPAVQQYLFRDTVPGSGVSTAVSGAGTRQAVQYRNEGGGPFWATATGVGMDQVVDMIGPAASANLRAIMTGDASVQRGRLSSGGGTATATNTGVGSIGLFDLANNEHQLIAGNASIGLGAVVVTNDNAIVAGDGAVSHGDGSITATGAIHSDAQVSVGASDSPKITIEDDKLTLSRVVSYVPRPVSIIQGDTDYGDDSPDYLYKVHEVLGTEVTNKIWTADSDGYLSGLDADTLDGDHASVFVRTSQYFNVVEETGVLNTPRALKGAGTNLQDYAVGVVVNNTTNLADSDGLVNLGELVVEGIVGTEGLVYVANDAGGFDVADYSGSNTTVIVPPTYSNKPVRSILASAASGFADVQILHSYAPEIECKLSITGTNDTLEGGWESDNAGNLPTISSDGNNRTTWIFNTPDISMRRRLPAPSATVVLSVTSADMEMPNTTLEFSVGNNPDTDPWIAFSSLERNGGGYLTNAVSEPMYINIRGDASSGGAGIRRLELLSEDRQTVYFHQDLWIIEDYVAPRVEGIMESAFRNNTTLTTVYLYNCERLGDANTVDRPVSALPWGLGADIAGGIFAGCYELQGLYAPKLRVVGRETFLGCGNLQIETESALPAVEYVGKSAFEGCSNLGDLIFDNLVYAGYRAFADCSGGTRMVFNKLKDVAPDMVKNAGYTELYLANAETIHGALPGVTLLNIPRVEYIARGVFDGACAITKLDAPKLKRILGDNHFPLVRSIYAPECEYWGPVMQGHTALTNLILGGDWIQPEAFKNCAKLAHVELVHAAVGSRRAFQNCNSLLSVLAPKMLIGGEEMFEGCNDMVYGEFDALREISDGMFEGCGTLKWVSVAEGMVGAPGDQIELQQGIWVPQAQSIGRRAFKDCRNLDRIYLPGVKHVGSAAFSKTPLNVIHLPDALTIGDSAFLGAGRYYVDPGGNDGGPIPTLGPISRVNLDSVVTLGARAFDGALFSDHEPGIDPNEEPQ